MLVSSSPYPLFCIQLDFLFLSFLPFRVFLSILGSRQVEYLCIINDSAVLSLHIHPSVPRSEAGVQGGRTSSLVSFEQWKEIRTRGRERLFSSPVEFTTCSAPRQTNWSSLLMHWGWKEWRTLMGYMDRLQYTVYQCKLYQCELIATIATIVHSSIQWHLACKPSANFLCHVTLTN